MRAAFTSPGRRASFLKRYSGQRPRSAAI
ncbi:hypothetical protein CCHL11_09408 [Colletotrichum chlorophyti]|uniref:Uncharacterized protein n=1 Tax=Colletotrichum chlorophyti TaxID=708187 RepID=A0A1Q8R9P1_9PEZI|nr:hypothetical protein CCHL11_09408 [Colletotrichum chlorophyti]